MSMGYNKNWGGGWVGHNPFSHSIAVVLFFVQNCKNLRFLGLKLLLKIGV
jgi:hypothetical protein